MLRSHNIQDVEVDFFLSFLDHAIKGEAKYRDLVAPIILDVAQLAKGEKEIYQLDRVGLNVKVILLNTASDILKEVTETNLDTYLEALNSVINSSRQTVFA
ncbi:hypothetical protein [Mucilaginibacter lacusdianchii]|uniref:hypothetical protein n=1 Tax=Mucilaginibacter lacusdianchii TaxID=2684211 RepID=UPI00131AF965|nr:hypothetical protein [Mucilaginibacter sp. JXJ CY 39]